MCKSCKRILSILLCICLLAGYFPMPAGADGELEPPENSADFLLDNAENPLKKDGIAGILSDNDEGEDDEDQGRTGSDAGEIEDEDGAEDGEDPSEEPGDEGIDNGDMDSQLGGEIPTPEEGTYPWDAMTDEEFTEWILAEENRALIEEILHGEDEEIYEALIKRIEELSDELYTEVAAYLIPIISGEVVTYAGSTSNIITNAQIEAAISWVTNYLTPYDWCRCSKTSQGYCSTGKHPYYSLCVALPMDGYEYGAGITGIQRASTAAQLGNNLITNTDLNPPRGALVFWSIKDIPAGHVALSLGGGKVIHYWTSQAAIQTISEVTSWGQGYTYRGWGSPLKGYTLATDTSGGGSGGSTTPAVPVTSVSVTGRTHYINVGSSSLQLTATVAPSNASNPNVTWKSDKTSVATVSSTGVVSGVAAGNATITATATDGSGKSAKYSITVVNVTNTMSAAEYLSYWPMTPSCGTVSPKSGSAVTIWQLPTSVNNTGRTNGTMTKATPIIGKGANHTGNTNNIWYQIATGFVYSGDVTFTAKDHTWNTGTVTKAATCAATGVKTYTCTVCGTTKTETIAKTTSHTWNSGTVTKQPTCAATGVKTYTCTVCSTTKTETIAKTTSHTWNSGTVTKAATCAAAGVKTYTCTVCGGTKTETIAKTTSHTWNSGTVTKQPTCAVEGVKTYTCTVCGETRTESVKKLTTHTYGTWQKADADNHKHTCSVCSTIETEAHSWNDGEVTTAATVAAEGIKTFTCTVCGETRTETIEKLAVTAISCLSAPAKTIYEFGEALDLSGMQLTVTYSDGTSETISTGYEVSGYNASAAGTQIVTISYQGQTTTITVEVKEKAPPANSVKISAETVTARAGDTVQVKLAISENTGIAALRIKVGYDSSAMQVVGASNGSVISGTLTQSPDFTKNPYVFNWISWKNSTGNGTIAAITFKVLDTAAEGDHAVTVSVEEALNAEEEDVELETYDGKITVTCKHTYGIWSNEDTINHVRSCSKCSEIDRASHSWNNGEITTAPTCTATGVKTYTCTVCGGTKTETIAKTTSHTWNSGTVTKQPTCAATGVKTYTCTVCSTTKTETIAKTTSHTWNSGTVTKAATCAATGVKTYTCTVCGGTKTETIAKTTSHTWNSGTVTKQPTCAAEGVKTYTCTICGETKTEPIEKTTTHTYGDWRKADDENHKHVCTVCSDEETEAHNWNDGEITTEPTCAATGVKTYTCTICGETRTETIEKLSVTAISCLSAPAKTIYEFGEALDLSGMQLTVTYSDGTSETISTGYEVSGYNASAAGTQIVTISYQGQTATITVQVKEQAPAANSVKISAETVTARAGETVQVKLAISENTGIAFLKLRVDYDEALTLVSAESTGLLSGVFTGGQTIDKKPYPLQWSNAADSTGNGEFAILTFTISDEAEDGNYALQVSCVEAANQNEEDVEIVISDPVITVRNYIPGDINMDGRVNGKDSIRLAQYLAEWDVVIDAQAADCNGDGKINGKDSIRLAQFLAEWDVVLH